jgi:NADH-quinone oxidoreductase subunit F
MVNALLNLARFYAHESCGKCSPCREGTYWMVRVLTELEFGRGRMEDIDLLFSIQSQIDGRSFCPLGDAAAWPVQGMLDHFRDEFEYHVTHQKCMFGARA